MNYKSIALYVCLLAGLAFGQTPTTVNGVPNQSTNAATAAGNNTFSGVNSFTATSNTPFAGPVSAPNLVTTNATGAQNITGSPSASFCAPLIGNRWKIDCLMDVFTTGTYMGAWSSVNGLRVRQWGVLYGISRLHWTVPVEPTGSPPVHRRT